MPFILNLFKSRNDQERAPLQSGLSVNYDAISSTPAHDIPIVFQNTSPRLINTLHDMKHNLVTTKACLVVQIESTAKMKVAFENQKKEFVSMLYQIAALSALLGNKTLYLLPISETAEKMIPIPLDKKFFVEAENANPEHPNQNVEALLEKMFRSTFLRRDAGPANFVKAFASSREFIAKEKSTSPIVRITLTQGIPISGSFSVKINDEFRNEFLRSAGAANDIIIGFGSTSKAQFPFLNNLPNSTYAAVNLFDKYSDFNIHSVIRCMSPSAISQRNAVVCLK